MTRRFLVLVTMLLIAASLAAQDDRTAGLFTKATQLPLVSQSVEVNIHGGEAVVELTQVFANPGAEITQADYRLHLPTEAVVTGFGFWHEGRYLAATLKEREQARQAHAGAASAGRTTGLLQREGTIHSFSVYPVLAGGIQEVHTTIVLPVFNERGRAHVRLPLDSFVGHARLQAGVVTRLQTTEPLDEVGVDGARFTERKRKKRFTELVFTADQPVEIWWAAKQAPLLTSAQAVAIEDGAMAIQLRLALNDPSAGGRGPSTIALLIDASHSMRRRGRAIEEFVGRVLDRARVPVRVFAVAEKTLEIPDREPREIVEVLQSGRAGFTSRWEAFETAVEDIGCSSPQIKCVALTDPQIDNLPTDRDLETFFLADADELAHFSDRLGRTSPVHQPGVDSIAGLHAMADELVLPVLELEGILQGGDELVPLGLPRRRVALGGLLRLHMESRSTERLRLELAIDDKTFDRRTTVEELDPDSRLGRSIRRGFYHDRLDDWMAEYNRTRDPRLRRQIVEISLREKIPTALTSLHVAAPRGTMARTATAAPLLRRIGLGLLAVGIAVLIAGWRWRF